MCEQCGIVFRILTYLNRESITVQQLCIQQHFVATYLAMPRPNKKMIDQAYHVALDYTENYSFREELPTNATPINKLTPSPVAAKNFSCEKENNNSFFASKDDCQMFYHCIGGKEYSYYCPANTVFDITRKACHFVNEVNKDLLKTCNMRYIR